MSPASVALRLRLFPALPGVLFESVLLLWLRQGPSMKPRITQTRQMSSGRYLEALLQEIAATLINCLSRELGRQFSAVILLMTQAPLLKQGQAERKVTETDREGREEKRADRAGAEREIEI